MKDAHDVYQLSPDATPHDLLEAISERSIQAAATLTALIHACEDTTAEGQPAFNNEVLSNLLWSARSHVRDIERIGNALDYSSLHRRESP